MFKSLFKVYIRMTNKHLFDVITQKTVEEYKMDIDRVCISLDG